MTAQEKLIFQFLAVTLVPKLLIATVRGTWFSDTFNTSAREADSAVIEQIA
ncbi:MAG: hypothetical protein VX822_04295 [Candidatus Neomarinimicrobiota bacterium]|nr:hypothetical protein [Candidatus Neomarinimicrobiota bacterium]